MEPIKFVTQKIVSHFFLTFFVHVWNCWTLRLQVQISLEIYGLMGVVRSTFLVKLASFLSLKYQNDFFHPAHCLCKHSKPLHIKILENPIRFKLQLCWSLPHSLGKLPLPLWWLALITHSLSASVPDDFPKLSSILSCPATSPRFISRYLWLQLKKKKVIIFPAPNCLTFYKLLISLLGFN